MSESAINGADAIASFAAAIGFSRKLDCTDNASQMDDADGPLPPGRYLLQILNPNAAGTIVWVKTVPFVAGETVSVDADAPSFPLQQNGTRSVAFNALRNVSDRVAAVCSTGGNAKLYITRVSRDA